MSDPAPLSRRPVTAKIPEGKTKTVKLRFKNQGKSVRRISKLLKRDENARRQNKLTVKVKATGPAGGTDSGKRKVKLRR